MHTLTATLSWLGASDQAITAMGPGLTGAIALVIGMTLAQLVKFPLAKLLAGDALAYSVELLGMLTAFGFAHYLSNHLSVPLEFAVAIAEPVAYRVLRGAAEKWAPWAAASLFRTVGPAA